MPEVRFAYLDPGAADVQALIAVADAYYVGLYPAESNHLEAVDDLHKPQAVLIGCFLDDELVASGAARLMQDDGDYAEIKRLFVLEPFRGRGLSSQLMSFLENELRQRGVVLFRLETGVRQPEALGLYRKLGYRERAPFGTYGPDSLSVFMEKSARLV